MTSDRPNILFILGESHAPDLLGAAGHPVIRTPNLDRLAARGTLFDAAYCASPLCVPARAALATGRFPHETGYWDSSMAFDGHTDSWMKRLRGAGYETVGIGKMHFRSDDDDNGFSRFIETMHIADGKGDLVSALRHEGREPSYQGLWDVWTSRYGAGDGNPYRAYDERIASEATNWLADEAAALDRPWALSVHFIAAHAPFVTPGSFRGAYDPDDVPPPRRFARDQRPDHPSVVHLREIVPHDTDMDPGRVQELRAAYYDTVSYLDDLAGRVLDTLEAQGLADNTLVIYTSDHGFSLGDHYIFGLFHMYEESLRVPLIMAGPGVPEGATASQPVSHCDLAPSILDAAQVPATGKPANPGSRSLWPVSRRKDEDRAVFAEYHGTATTSAGYVLREGRYKLIHFIGMDPQLFDLDTDPDEAQNLAADPEYVGRLDRMMARLLEFVDPEAADKAAKAAQKALIERHGGREKVLRDMAGFAYSPPPGVKWQSMTDDSE